MNAPSTTSSTITFAAAFRELLDSHGPSPEAVAAAFDAVFAGDWTPVQVAGFLVAIRMRGETPAILAAAAQAMRRVAVPVQHGLDVVLDTCGTGGDGLRTLNLSTAAAVVVAAAGVPVAKHGNRAASSQTGSADVLEALGIPVDVPPSRHAQLLRDVGITFLFARLHHPAMRHAAQARSELGVRTLFNGLGPLANPAGVKYQLIGTYDHAVRPMMAETLRLLGSKRVWVVRGEDGLDEVSPTGPTRVTELDEGEIRERVVTPEDFGLRPGPLSAIAGGAAEQNARALTSILAGEAHPAADAVVLNAAAALVVALNLKPTDAAEKARDALTSGRAFAKLQQWRTKAQEARQAP